MAYNILIVDSQRERIRSLQKALAQIQESFIMTGVLSGEEGLLDARLNPVDLVISTARLPGMDGGTLLKSIRAVRPSVRCILINHQQSTGKALLDQADVHLDAPFDDEAFLMAVTDLLGLNSKAFRKKHASGTASAEAPKTQTGIAERLTRLRHEVGAETVILVNDSGEVLVRAGSLTEPDLEAAVIPALMSALSAGARISRFLGSTDHPNHYFYRGERTHLVMSAVGQSWALVIGTLTEMTAERASAIHSAAAETIREISPALAELGIPLTPEEPGQVPPFLTDLDDIEEEAAVAADPALEQLFKNPPPAAPEDADAFWAPGEEGRAVESPATDALTYQQAVQLGLAPQDSDTP